MLELLDEVVKRTAAGEAVGVCMVAATRGSTPQKSGAVMLVLENGATLGTLGGGCVEAEVRTRAQELMRRNESRTLTFKLDGDYGWDDGLVCGGSMDVAVATAHDSTAYADVIDAVNRGESATLRVVDAEHVVEPPPRLVIAGAGHVGQALAAIAGPAGFDVTVIDDRPDCANADRFPDAHRIVGDIERELRRL
ncbi:MAG: XdhC family protein, partial [Planctomycetota bacterium]